VFNVSNLPLISQTYPTSILDASHALLDKLTWAFYWPTRWKRRLGSEDS
jgi:hypothetical protein